ncbi:DUF6602 domain-containing protein [Phormidium nigroviride]
MANKIFEQLLLEQIEIFRDSFLNRSKNLFFNEEGKLIHPGEYGTYREAIVKDFLQFLVPRNLDISQGFIINSSDEISTQCDIVVYDAGVTPLIQSESRQRFFPVETVCAVGEIKSTLSKQDFKKAINKLSQVKKQRESIKTRTLIRKAIPGDYHPETCPYDQLFTFIVCQKLNFDIEDIAREINNIYDVDLPYRYRHNLVLSLEDGLLLYYDSRERRSLYYPYILRENLPENLKNRLMKPDSNDVIHYKLFATYIFMGISQTTILFPEMADYISDNNGRIHGFINLDEP